jgi:hypothetical protein
MPVHNAAPFLDESIGSILDQSFVDFELVILDDGSTDGSDAILRRWAGIDERIRLICNPRRTGAAASSNRVARAAGAPLIARMDADDVAYPGRLERQFEALADHPDAVLAGTLAETVDARGRRVRPADFPRLLRASAFAPFGHSSIMVRKPAFERAGGYREAAEKWEDVDLYLRLARQGRILVVPEVLMRFRQTGYSTRSADGEAALESAMALMYRCVSEHEAGRDHDPLLAAPPQAGLLEPRVLVECGSGALWAGRRPRMFRRAWRRMAREPGAAALKVLIWAAWADLSPRSLRAALRLKLAMESRNARQRLRGMKVVEWRPLGAATGSRASSDHEADRQL